MSQIANGPETRPVVFNSGRLLVLDFLLGGILSRDRRGVGEDCGLVILRVGFFSLALLLLGAAQALANPSKTREPMLFFWGVGCPHCEAAKPFVERLGKQQPDRPITWIEVRRDAAGRARYGETVRALGAHTPNTAEPSGWSWHPSTS